MGLSPVRELTDRVNDSLERSRAELLEYARKNHDSLQRALNEGHEAVIRTRSGDKLVLRTDESGRLRVK